MNKSKILFLASTFPRWKGDSTPRFVYDLAERIASKYRVMVLAPHHHNACKKEAMGKVEVRRFSYFKPESMQKLCYNGGMIPNMKKSLLAKLQLPFLLIAELFSSYWIMKKENIGLLHAHWILPQGLIASILKKNFRVPLVVTIHGSDLFPLKNRAYRIMQKFVLKHSDIITVNSAAAKNELAKRFRSYSKKVNIIPMGVDVKLFRKRVLPKPKEYAKNRIILFVGRLSEQKGIQCLIDSLPEILKGYQNAKLLIIGSGPFKSSLMDMAEKNGLAGKIDFLGPKSSEEIANYYNFCDVFVLPSLSNKTGTESLGLSLLEAMASGTAVIGTKVGGIPETISDGHNGLLVRQNDAPELSKAIISILSDRKMAVKLGNSAMKFVKAGYSWENVSNKFIKIYSSMLK